MSKKWFESYQEGVPHEIDMSEYKSIVEVI